MKFFASILILLLSCNNSANTVRDQKDSLDSVGQSQKHIIDSAADKSREQVDSIEKAGKNGGFNYYSKKAKFKKTGFHTTKAFKRKIVLVIKLNALYFQKFEKVKLIYQMCSPGCVLQMKKEEIKHSLLLEKHVKSSDSLRKSF